MPKKKQTAGYDLRFLEEATRSLLGYFVHTWYRHYLAVIVNSFRRLIEFGAIRGIFEPIETSRLNMLFDFNALNIEKVTYINGIYYYILSAHKGANFKLMHRNPQKQVLYLRGYDFEGSVTTGEGLALGFSSMNTTAFTQILGDKLSGDVQLFKVFSPKDVYWETADAQRLFYGNYEDIPPLARYRMCSLFLNAQTWKEDVIHLLDRMDHYIVYVSSITKSVLWELDQLDTGNRRDRVTVVFDREAILNKELQYGMRDWAKEEFGDQLIWAKKGLPPDLTVDELHKHLSGKFLVTTPEDFKKDIRKHRSRIDQSSSLLPPGERETWIDFRYYPCLEEAGLKQLRDFSADVGSNISTWTGKHGIVCLPLFFNLVQLRVFLTLLLGEHFETGRALASYAAVMQAVHDYYAAPGEKVGDLSKEGKERHLEMLLDHLEMARHVGWHMLAFGKSHEFNDNRQVAFSTFNNTYRKTKKAVGNFFAKAISENK